MDVPTENKTSLRMYGLVLRTTHKSLCPHIEASMATFTFLDIPSRDTVICRFSPSCSATSARRFHMRIISESLEESMIAIDE